MGHGLGLTLSQLLLWGCLFDSFATNELLDVYGSVAEAMWDVDMAVEA